MSSARSKTFKSGNSEALRLPKDVAFGGEVEVTIYRSGDVLTIVPARASIAEMVRRLEALPRPSSVEERDVEILPEPPGL